MSAVASVYWTSDVYAYLGVKMLSSSVTAAATLWEDAIAKNAASSASPTRWGTALGYSVARVTSESWAALAPGYPTAGVLTPSAACWNTSQYCWANPDLWRCRAHGFSMALWLLLPQVLHSLLAISY